VFAVCKKSKDKIKVISLAIQYHFLPYPQKSNLNKDATFKSAINKSAYFPLLKKMNSAIIIFNLSEKRTSDIKGDYMRKLIPLFLLVALLGCYNFQKSIVKLSPGDSKERVIEIMGTPTILNSMET